MNFGTWLCRTNVDSALCSAQPHDPLVPSRLFSLDFDVEQPNPSCRQLSSHRTSFSDDPTLDPSAISLPSATYVDIYDDPFPPPLTIRHSQLSSELDDARFELVID
jgi:hypothetical protein